MTLATAPSGGIGVGGREAQEKVPGTVGVVLVGVAEVDDAGFQVGLDLGRRVARQQVAD